MKYHSALVLLASTLSIATAGTIPWDQVLGPTWTNPNTNDTGNTILVFHNGGQTLQRPPAIGSSPGLNITSITSSDYFPPYGEVHCSGHPFPDMTWLKQTVHDIGVWCKAHTLGGLCWEIWWYGGAQSYVCNYSYNWNRCDEDEFWRANAMFDDICGLNGAYIWIPRWAKVIGRDPNDVKSFTPECTNMGW